MLIVADMRAQIQSMDLLSLHPNPSRDTRHHAIRPSCPLSPATDTDLSELAAIRRAMVAHAEIVRDLATQAIRIASARLAAGLPLAADRREIQLLLRALAHITRIGVGGDAPMVVIGRCSSGADVLVVIAEGTAVVQCLAGGALEEVGLLEPTLAEAAMWLDTWAPELAGEVEAMGVEALPTMIVGLLGRKGA